MNIWWRLCWRDLVRQPRFSLLFIINLIIGLSGFLLVSSFGGAIKQHLETHLTTLLTADLVVRSSRPLAANEEEAVTALTGPGSRFSTQISFYSMVKGTRGVKLSRLAAIDRSYPLHGELPVGEEGGQSGNDFLDAMQAQPLLLMTLETARALALEPGSEVRIGQSTFRVAARLVKDPAGAFSGIELAPTVYLGLAQAKGTGLLQFGSRIAYKRFIRLPEAAGVAATATALTKALSEKDGTDTGIRVTTTADMNRRFGQLIGLFREFLGFAALVSLALAGMTSAYLFHGQIVAHAKEMAVLLTLGATRRQWFALQIARLSLLGLGAALLAQALAISALPGMARLFASLVPQGMALSVGLPQSLAALVIGCVGSPLFCLPVFLRVRRIDPADLLQGTMPFRPSDMGKISTLLGMVPAILLLILLATTASKSALHAAAFAGSLLAVMLLLFALGGLLLDLGSRISVRGLPARLIQRNLIRRRWTTLALFTTMAGAVLLTAIIPQIEQGLRGEIAHPEELELPDLFLIDIQEEQQQPLRDFFRDTQWKLSPLAPMVQGRIVSINQVPFIQWRARQQTSESVVTRRTEFNFSSREQLDPSESIVKGRALASNRWTGEPGEPFEISMEQRFSEQLGVDLGDRLVFSIQGIELEGVVVNLRSVRWNSFQPNFFMLVQPGVLDEAPKTMLASISRVDSTEKTGLMNRLNETFANISVLDVGSMVAQLEDLAGKLTQSLASMAALAVVAGLLALYAVVREEARRREQEINLLRVLGAGTGRIRLLFALEFGLLGGLAGTVAVSLSVVCSWVLAQLLFDRLWSVQWSAALLLLAAAGLISAGTALAVIQSVIRRKPSDLLA